MDARRRAPQYEPHVLYKTDAAAAGLGIRLKGIIMANLLLALVTAELSLFGVDAAAPVTQPVADAAPAGSAPSFDSEHYRSALD